VERLEPPQQTAGGLFLPSSDKEPLHVVRVASLGNGVVGESGVTAPNEVSFILLIFTCFCGLDGGGEGD
jgi:co-chaperonin GroES (HSP10)